MAPLDDRAVSEGAAIAALVLLTVAVTASVGVGVLLVETGPDNEFDAELSYQYFDGRQALLVTYEEGQNLTAGNVVFRGASEVTWADVGSLNESDTITPGANAQLSPNNAYGAEVTESTNITVVYVQDGNETQLDTWTGPDS
ncbi:type IV pilin [Halobacteriales archaeon SW_10_68_16]|jgi:hypothetical protein|nr:MAG: type IV pilin [Halobacteriales archaeon SW_10_68_16]